MRFSRAFIPTLKETPADAQVVSHVYLVRGGYLRQLAAGIYNLLPLGWRVIKKIEDIVRDEMNRAGAEEVLMPASVPAELWQESGRWQVYGPELLRWKDRKGAEFCTGPTHEEVIVDMVRRDTSSYRDLPLNLYQIQSKFRDEKRPRAGLMRGREFIMKDAYSFDRDEAGALKAYDAMYAAYGRIFKRCGLDFRAVEADTGAIGGSRSHEFQVLAESGEDAIVSCDTCDYAANVEQAEIMKPAEPGIQGAGELTAVATPTQKTIDDVSKFLGVAPSQLIKTLVYMADGSAVAAIIRGDRELNEIAFKKAVGATQLYLARDEEVVAATGVAPGFVGPVGLNIPVYADLELEGATGAVTGANRAGHHNTGVDLARDAKVTKFASIRLAGGGDKCPRCPGGHFRPFKGIEVGHVFFLGTKYSVPMKCNFLDEDRQTKPMVMGCYGIGITRIAAAAIEQNHDANGICWPLAIAPFEVEVISLQPGDAAVKAAADALYAELTAAGVEVLYDDRDERPGAKFKDADLIGVPLRIAIGARSLKEGKLEFKRRTDKDATLIAADGAAAYVAGLVAAEKATFRS
ncbi:MAG: proline--tRNA ligase [Deltaproteobacteria bacterium]|nr:proline--tRNA ligase [Deltaproteobacteria bacterium]